MTARQRAQIGIVGVGNLGSALVRGWLRAEGSRAVVPEAPLLVFDADAPRAAALAAESGGRVLVAESAAAVAAAVGTLVLSVKPEDLIALLGDVALLVDSETTVVSTAAGVGLPAARTAIGAGPHLFRIMPNLAVALGLGVVALAPEAGETAESVQRVVQLMEPLGLVEVLPERYFDAVTSVTGSGPGFLALVAEGFEDGAVRAGLPRGVARRFVRQTFSGTAALLEGTGHSAAELKDAVASPGGTTIAGLAVLEERSVRGALIRAVETAAERGRELSEGRA